MLTSSVSKTGSPSEDFSDRLLYLGGEGEVGERKMKTKDVLDARHVCGNAVENRVTLFWCIGQERDAEERGGSVGREER